VTECARLNDICQYVELGCRRPECLAIEEEEFGACDMLLGYGVNDAGQCVPVSGCECDVSCEGRVFESEDACENSCAGRAEGQPCGPVTDNASLSVNDSEGTPLEEGGRIGFQWGGQGSMMLVTRLVLSQTSNVVNVRAEVVQTDGDMMSIGVRAFDSTMSNEILRCLPLGGEPLGWTTQLWIEFDNGFEENELIGMPVALTVSVSYEFEGDVRELQSVINGTLDLL